MVYGMGREAVLVSVERSALREALTTEAGLNAVIRLRTGGEEDLVLVKEIQRDPVRRDVLHVDFVRVDPKATVEVTVPLVLEGEPEKLTREGGLVEQLMHEIQVHAPLHDIPNEIRVDISALSLDEPVRLKDVVLPEGVTCELDPDESVAVGYVPRGVEAARAAAAGGATPEGDETRSGAAEEG